MDCIRQYAVAFVFFGASLAMLIIKLSPALGVLLKYGKTAALHSAETSLLHRFSYFVASFTVPKTFFTHFYLGFCLLLMGPKTAIFTPFNDWLKAEIGPGTSQNSDKYALIWLLLVFQGLRRLLECICITKSAPNARINVLHYVAGFTFYPLVTYNCLVGQLQSANDQRGSNAIFTQHLSPQSCWLTVAFVVFSVDQFCNHWHLSRLVKYSVPKYGLFKLVSCAHYLDEICIYLVIVTISFANGTLTAVDVNFAAALVFVVVNLCLSSLESKDFYTKKFDDYKVRWAVIPGVI